MRISTLFLHGLYSHQTLAKNGASRLLQCALKNSFSTTHIVPKHPLQVLLDRFKTVDLQQLDTYSPCSNTALQDCLKQMNNIVPSDLSINSLWPVSNQGTYCLSIFESPLLHISAFVIPAGVSLPLHDHPGMVVLTKLIQGQIKIRSFTAVSTDPQPQVIESKRGRFAVSIDDDFMLDNGVVRTKNCSAWLLSANAGNYHEIYAETDCVMLDAFLPPYHLESGRKCTYYSVSTVAGDNLAPLGHTLVSYETKAKNASSSKPLGHPPKATITSPQFFLAPMSTREISVYWPVLPVAYPYTGYKPVW